ncbi:hypothetical protein NPIL_116551 [Nephila pilipes]|uniref:Uncharacterized protein n=1 Tax=Nephila pilipes TaxID=299642 RepID=A0A8X6JBH6_NEPPI|nr:hypothetical protein NPIL_116551 [Nephila pilipes]
MLNFLSFNNNILKYYFRYHSKNAPQQLFSFIWTKAWFSPIIDQKHLNIFHKCPPSGVHCFSARRKLKSPALHPCLKQPYNPKAPIVDDSEWTCEICNTFSTIPTWQAEPPSVDKRDHQEKCPPLIIPESNAALKEKEGKSHQPR